MTGEAPLRDEDLLNRLVVEARQDLQRRRDLIAQDVFERSVAAYTPKDFAGALRARGLAVIAEMKQRTPSMGVLAEDYRPADLAHAYADGGAAAISVLTHMAGFGGRPEHIQAARAATGLPILRKDFVTDPYEIAEARAAGADAVLLIVAALDRVHLAEMLAVARSRGIAALVEVHDEPETQLALEAGAEIIGVNHRDLRTFTVDLALTERLRKLIPQGAVVVAESGIRTPADARRMYEAGADAILVGEVLMRSDDPAKQIRELTQWSA
ncbi:MAG TPA: indole-3-glycerol phosphate synthase TrpC [Candidatus Dormibacteraeota bacterium]|nr:indole-3-glycerol phosphate synthase TrpC [Candidatus Dormibacteraeota bacterium]